MKQAYICVCQYPGLKQFKYGTVVLDAKAKHHEVEAAMLERLAACFPPGYKVLRIIPGHVWFEQQGDGWDVQ